MSREEKRKVKITSHYCDVFAKIFKVDGTSFQEIQDSLDLVKNHNMVLKAGEGAGRSGSFFFFSYDNKYLVKTVNSVDKSKLDQIIYKYHEHIAKLHKEGKSSLLARIYGVYTIDCKFFDPVNVIVM